MQMTYWGIVKTPDPFNESLIGFPFHNANKMELTEISKNRDRDYFHYIIKWIYVDLNAHSQTAYMELFTTLHWHLQHFHFFKAKF